MTLIIESPQFHSNQPSVLYEFFQRAAQRWPDAIAIDVPPAAGRPHRKTISYAELKYQSDLLAQSVHLAVGSDQVIAIYFRRNTEWLYIAQLAVMRSASAYVCIDPIFPNDQISHIFHDSEVAAILTDAEGAERLKRIGYKVPIIRVDQPHNTSTTRLPAPPVPESIAYIIYTSGSTGMPKGVMISHKSIANLIGGDVAEFNLVPGDRMGQGSSASFDASVEEIWMALSTGATVVVMDEDTVRLGPDLVRWLRDERITVISPPPTLLQTTGCKDPQTELPDLRLLYVGGEALNQDVADRWSLGRRMVNAYGPTECTVTCLRYDVVPGEKVSIGRPVPGMQAWVLDDNLEPVPYGDKGELCIGGVGLALGYLNKPELDSSKFPHHPKLGRIYRTGDLVHAEPDGTFFYHGRIDSQVKLRGFRIELEAIESCLARCLGIHEVACRVQGEGSLQVLAAHVVADPNCLPPVDELKHQLRKLLPEYMVPSVFGTIKELPRSATSGKLRRSDLPILAVKKRQQGPATTPPHNPMEKSIAEAVRRVLDLPDLPSVSDDFFMDLGGSSLTAAMLITELRANPDTSSITVRDLYEARTIEQLARRAAPSPSPGPEVVQPEQSSGNVVSVTIAQSVWLLLELFIGSALGYLIFFWFLPLLSSKISTIDFLVLVVLGPLLLAGGRLVLTPLAVAIAVSAKKILIGQYKPTRAPVWSSFYVRMWIVRQFTRFIPWRIIEGTEFQCMALRALGARIGKRVHIHRGVNLLQGGWDLLNIGDDVTISQDAMVGLVQLEKGQVVVGPITLEDGATLDIRAGVGPNTQVGHHAWLSALSWLPEGRTIPAGEKWDGVPAQSDGKAPKPPMLTDSGRILPPIVHGIAMILSQSLLRWVIDLPFTLALVLIFIRFDLTYDSFLSDLTDSASNLTMLVITGASISLGLVCSLALNAVATRALGRVSPGVISRWSLAYIRVWLKTGLVNTANTWLSGGLYWPMWLRVAGMKVGHDVEISTITDSVPELIQINSRSFLADGIYLGGPRIQQGTVTLANVLLDKNTFLGNHVVIAAGQQLPQDILIGISTVADDRIVRPGSSWFGHPPFELPHREIVTVDRSLAYDPPFIRIVSRVFWEWLRFLLPIVPMLSLLLWVDGVNYAKSSMSFEALLLFGVPTVSMATGSLSCLFVLGLKWGLLGRVREGIHPLWSCWINRWDFLYIAWGNIAHGLLSNLEGTLLLAVYLRRMGMKIGKRVVLGEGFSHVVDPDMLEIGDGATVNAMFQAHSFEDRVLKIGHIRVGAYSTLGNGTVPLYGADIGKHTFVAPYSVIMKHEHLQPWLRYEGAPTRRQQEYVKDKAVTKTANVASMEPTLRKQEYVKDKVVTKTANTASMMPTWRK